jgi:HAD superfamily hydrolase (TIGR01509 family)
LTPAIPAFPAYLFDVDGTLTNSAPDICGAIREVLSPRLAARGTEVTDAFLTSFIGRHLFELFETLFPGMGEAEMGDILNAYKAVYATRGHSSTVLYPGVYEAISALPGRKSTATTKGTPTTRIILEKFGLLPYFDHVQGTDGFPAKPAPDVVLRSVAALGADPAACLLVGDSPADMQAGRRAGVRLCAVTYGYGDPGLLRQCEPDYWIDDLRQLLAS